MKLSSKVKNGLEFLIELAMRHADDSPMTLKDVSDRRNISEKYLWQVVAPLKSAGIVSATPGVKGGYRLAMAPRDISLRSIVEAEEGAVLQIGGIVDSPGSAFSEDDVEKEVWNSVSRNFSAHLEKVTLGEIADRKREQCASLSLSYCI